MDVREKLVDIVCDATQINGCIHSCNHPPCAMVRGIVDALIENGVTVQEWISVDDRLPDDDEVVIICTDKNFVYAGELIGDTWFLDNDSWTATVTHWMPTPNPPKGE